MMRFGKIFAAALAAAVSVCAFGEDAYLEATGAQAINTGYFANPKTKIVADFAFTSLDPVSQRLFGADNNNDDSGTFTFSFYFDTAKKYGYSCADGRNHWQNIGLAASMSRSSVTLDAVAGTVAVQSGTTVKSVTITDSRTQTSNWPLAIFANNRSTDFSSLVANQNAKVKLYSMTIYDGDSLVHYYKPYKNGSVVGLKDLVTGDILENALTGEGFKSGGDIGDDPSWDLENYRKTDGGAIEYRVKIGGSDSVGGDVSVDGAEGPFEAWVAQGTEKAYSVVLTPNAGAAFVKWTGDTAAITTGAATDTSVMVTAKGPIELQPTYSRTIYYFYGANNSVLGSTATFVGSTSSTTSIAPDFASGNGIFRFDRSSGYTDVAMPANTVLKMYGIRWYRTWGSFNLNNGQNSAIELGEGGMLTEGNCTAYNVKTQIRLVSDQAWNADNTARTITAQGGVSGNYTLTLTGAGVKSIGGTTSSYNVYDWPRTVIEGGTVKLAGKANFMPANHMLVFDCPGSKVTLSLTAYDQTLENGTLVEMPRRTATNELTTDAASTKKQLIFTGTPGLSAMGFGGKLTQGAGVCWNPTDAAYSFTFTNSVSDTQGNLTVLNGTMRVAAGATFPTLASVKAQGANARFEVAADAGALAGQSLVVADGAKVKVGADRTLVFDSVKVNGIALAGGTYTAATASAWLEGEGAVIVAGGSWTAGGGTDTSVLTAANWGGVSPDFQGGNFTPIFASAGATATLPTDLAATIRGIIFDGSRPFTLDAAEGATPVKVGAAGVTTQDAAADIAYTLGWPVELAASQTWSVGAKGTLNVTGGFKAGSGTLQFDCSGKVKFTGESTTTCPIQLNKGTFYFEGTNTMGVGTANVVPIWNTAVLHFGNGRETRPFVGTTKTSYPTVYIDAGKEMQFDGLVKCSNDGLNVNVADNATVYFHGGFAPSGCWNKQGNGTMIIDTVPMTSCDRWYQGAGTVEFRVANNQINGNAGTFSGGRLNCRVPYALNHKVNNKDQRLNFTGGTIDLCGNDQAMGVLGCRGGTITSATPALMHLVDDYNNTEGEFGKSQRTNACVFAGCAGLSKEGSYDHTLVKASTTTGTLAVAKGTLTMFKDATRTGSWLNSTNVVVTGGKLVLMHNMAFGRKVVFSVGGSGKADLAFVGTQDVKELYLNGVSVEAGKTYGGSASDADIKNDTYFTSTGTGKIRVHGVGLVLYIR